MEVYQENISDDFVRIVETTQDDVFTHIIAQDMKYFANISLLNNLPDKDKKFEMDQISLEKIEEFGIFFEKHGNKILRRKLVEKGTVPGNNLIDFYLRFYFNLIKKK